MHPAEKRLIDVYEEEARQWDGVAKDIDWLIQQVVEAKGKEYGAVLAGRYRSHASDLRGMAETVRTWVKSKPGDHGIA